MKKEAYAAAMLSLFLTIAGCVGAPAEKPVTAEPASERRVQLMRSTVPEPGIRPVPLFFAAAARMADREAEHEAAVQSLARQAAMFGRVSGLDVVIGAQDSGQALTLQNTRWKFNRQTARRLHREVEIVAEHTDEEGTYLLARFPSLKSTHEIPPVKPLIGYAQRPPVWTKKIPRLSGYRVAVGSASRRRLFSESIEAADRNALAAMLSQAAVLVLGTGDRGESHRGTVASAKQTHVSVGTVRGFYILDRWISADNGTFFSLAVAEF